ncbi:50S ribosomal protein L3 [Candidatus Peregrinibacteria bacterium]|nr:50S ribosomal protein L3 [Candidatus Peregrinibacteria bacterium]
MNGILGKKLGMTRVIKEDGLAVPVTILECSPNVISQIKTAEKDGYNAVVLGFEERKRPSKNKKFYFSKEFKVDSIDGFEKAATLDISRFAEGDQVSLSGISKGKGFQGGIKRWNFSRGPETHGSHHHREPGAVGGCASPGKIFKGKKLPGRMGGGKVTIRSTTVEYVDTQKNLIGFKGPVPGSINSYVKINKLS